MSRTTEALRKAAQIQAANNGGAQGSSSCRSFSSVAGTAPIPPYAKPGERYTIYLPDHIKNLDESSRVRPAILWGVYRNEEGDVVAADFLKLSSKKNGTEGYKGNFYLSYNNTKQGKALSYVVTSSLYTLSNRLSKQGGNIFKRTDSESGMSYLHLPDLVLRRVFNLCMNSRLSILLEPDLDLSGTVREGIYFPTLKRCNLRSDMLQPDVPDEIHNFIHREIVLPGGLTQDDVNRIAAWSGWWATSGQVREQGWPKPGTFRTLGWPGWDDPMEECYTSFKDWEQIPENDRFPRGRPAPDHGNCNSVSQPSGPASLRL